MVAYGYRWGSEHIKACRTRMEEAIANDEKDIERMAAQKSKMEAYAAAEVETIIEKEDENAESKDDIEMRADPPENELIDLQCARGSIKENELDSDPIDATGGIAS